MQEEMHEQMSGYKRMRREHQGALVRIETTFYPTFSRSGRAQREGRTRVIFRSIRTRDR